MGISKDEIVNFMSTELAVDMTNVDSETLLFSSGMVDSFALVTLVLFLEKTYDFRMGALDVNLDNLDSIEKIMAFVEQKAAAI